VHVQLSGDCADLYQFLQQMESPGRAARLTAMSLHKAEIDGDVSADLTVRLYFSPALGVGPASQAALIGGGGE